MIKVLPYILRKNKEEIGKICQNYGIKYLSLFGSFARRDFKEDSDIDLLVKFKDTKSLLDIIHIENEFSELLGRKVEIVESEAISEKLKEYIMAETIKIYEKR